MQLKERKAIISSNSNYHKPSNKSRLPLIVALLIINDLVAVTLSFYMAYFIRKWIPFLSPLAHGIDVYLQVWLVVFLWPLFFWRENLYPGFWLTTRQELQKTFSATTISSVVAMALTFVTKTGIQYSRPIIVGGWLLTLFFIPASRFAMRRFFTSLGFYGSRAVILGAGKTARIVVHGCRNQSPPAILPVALFDDDPEKSGTELEGIPILGSLSEAPIWSKLNGISTVVIAMPGIPRDRLIHIIESQSGFFQRVIVVPDLLGISVTDTYTHELQGILIIEIRKNLLYFHNQIIKRSMDLFLALSLGIVVFPLVLLIGILIRLESPGPIFFRQLRVGKGGKLFEALKFRTMVENSDAVLAQYLSANPHLRKEWDETQKLKYDPRITKVGAVLRRLSLDELPQLINILRGEMSLVGPRPIVEEEKRKYGDRLELYLQVLPGLTGLWQVSGRSTLSYEDRVWLDTHYVRNWSIWLDLVILVRTVWVIITGVGAY